jgi:6-phosphogluconolactonase
MVNIVSCSVKQNFSNLTNSEILHNQLTKKMMLKLKTFPDKESLARDFGDMLQQLASDRETISIALSGGSTPKVVFDILSAEYLQKIAWSKLRLFWGDERCVAPDDKESNYGMTKHHLIDKVPILPQHIFRVMGELEPKEAARQYVQTLTNELPLKNGLPEFDLVLLGMGDDGHTASVFPHEIHLWDTGNVCEVATHPESGQKRVTLTGNVINNAQNIVFLVTGSSKAEKVHEIINKKGQFNSYPASLVDTDKSTWMLDEEAAKLL